MALGSVVLPKSTLPWLSPSDKPGGHSGALSNPSVSRELLWGPVITLPTPLPLAAAGWPRFSGTFTWTPWGPSARGGAGIAPSAEASPAVTRRTSTRGPDDWLGAGPPCRTSERTIPADPSAPVTLGVGARALGTPVGAFISESIRSNCCSAGSSGSPSLASPSRIRLLSRGRIDMSAIGQALWAHNPRCWNPTNSWAPATFPALNLSQASLPGFCACHPGTGATCHPGAGATCHPGAGAMLKTPWLVYCRLSLQSKSKLGRMWYPLSFPQSQYNPYKTI